MRVSLRQIGRWGLLLVSTAALWWFAPVWQVAMQTEQAFAGDDISPVQINQLGRRVALRTYYDVASSAQVSAGGYGGPGHSGGDGDSLVRIVNEGNFEAITNGRPGALCANFYVFDDESGVAGLLQLRDHGGRSHYALSD